MEAATAAATAPVRTSARRATQPATAAPSAGSGGGRGPPAGGRGAGGGRASAAGRGGGRGGRGGGSAAAPTEVAATAEVLIISEEERPMRAATTPAPFTSADLSLIRRVMDTVPRLEETLLQSQQHAAELQVQLGRMQEEGEDRQKKLEALAKAETIAHMHEAALLMPSNFGNEVVDKKMAFVRDIFPRIHVLLKTLEKNDPDMDTVKERATELWLLTTTMISAASLSMEQADQPVNFVDIFYDTARAEAMRSKEGWVMPDQLPDLSQYKKRAEKIAGRLKSQRADKAAAGDSARAAKGYGGGGGGSGGGRNGYSGGGGGGQSGSKRYWNVPPQDDGHYRQQDRGGGRFHHQSKPPPREGGGGGGHAQQQRG